MRLIYFDMQFIYVNIKKNCVYKRTMSTYDEVYMRFIDVVICEIFLELCSVDMNICHISSWLFINKWITYQHQIIMLHIFINTYNIPIKWSYISTSNNSRIDIQWRIQKFKNRGARSRRGIVFEVWRLFWYPFTHTLCFCSERRE